MYSISHVAELTGIPLATLRAWERRYDVVRPSRTSGGFRAYTDADVNILLAMRELVDAGWAPRHAAEQARGGGSAGAADPFGFATRVGAATPGPGASVPGATGADTGAARAAAPTPDVVAAAAALDVVALDRALDGGFARGSFERVVDDWPLPQLDELGRAWELGVVGVAGEHLVAHAVAARLSAAYAAAAAPTSGPSVVIALPPGARHELGLLAFAVAARRRGLRTTYLGADLPESAWVAAVTEHQASAAVTSVAQASDVAAVVPVMAALRRARPWMLVAVGGRFQASVEGQCLRLGHGIAAGADRLAQALAGGAADG